MRSKDHKLVADLAFIAFTLEGQDEEKAVFLLFIRRVSSYGC